MAGDVCVDIAREPDGDVVLGRRPESLRPAGGSSLRLGIDPGEVHVFDARTGLAMS